MGRQVYRVPADWVHPKQERSNAFQPMHMDRDFSTEAREWLDEALAWDNGTHKDLQPGGLCDEGKEEHPFYWTWAGDPPDPKYYRPMWRTEPTHYQMYETTSEGTPISPVMESPEALARWLTDNHASAFGGSTASYEGWLRVCNGGYAPSMVFNGTTLTSGVDGL